jgi:hypothetical protein
MRLQDGDEIVFFGGDPRRKVYVPLPNPRFCNLKLAIARAVHACGASEIMDQLYGNDDDDDEAIMTLPVGRVFQMMHFSVELIIDSEI